MTWLRAFAVVCILLCHYVQESTNIYLQMSAQVFNIGVNLFFIISGFCLGLQGEIKDKASWYKKRLKRIYIPCWLFLSVLLLTYGILGIRFNFWNFLTCFMGIQGAKVGIWGADHTWFITAILLCYLITPFVQNKIMRKTRFFLGILPIAFVPNPSVHTLLAPVCFYLLAYYMGRKYQGNNVSLKKAGIALICIVASFIIRFGIRIFVDGTIFYERIVASYTQYLAAFGIFIVFAYIFKNVTAGKICKSFCGISFELYLCHYMFVVGPVALMHLTSDFIVNVLLTTMVVLVVAVILNKFSGIFLKRI